MNDQPIVSFVLIGLGLLGIAWLYCRSVGEYSRLIWQSSDIERSSKARLNAALQASSTVWRNAERTSGHWKTSAFFAKGVCLLLADLYFLGPTPLGLYSQAFLLAQLVLGTVCAEHGILPDSITISLASVGLYMGAAGLLLTPSTVIFGLLVGGIVPYAASAFFGFSNGKPGLGGGVMKHAAAVGAWIGPGPSIVVLTLASTLGFVLHLVNVLRGKPRQTEVNFGPVYAFAAAIIFLLLHATIDTPLQAFLKKII